MSTHAWLPDFNTTEFLTETLPCIDDVDLTLFVRPPGALVPRHGRAHAAGRVCVEAPHVGEAGEHLLNDGPLLRRARLVEADEGIE